MAGSEKRTTLREVAQLAGVSQATASKVLNGRGDVAPHTRERVLEVMKAQRYARTGSRTAHETTPPLVAVFASLTSQYASLILQGIVSAAAERSTDVVVRLEPTGFHRLGDRATRAWMDSIPDAAGIIAVTSVMARSLLDGAARRKIPLVSIDPVDSFDESIVSIGSTDWAGARSVTEHLLALGHRHIAWIGGPTGSAPTIERFHGYTTALAVAGVPEDPALQRNGPYTFESGAALAGELLDSGVEVTAVVCGSDAIAFGAMSAARGRGLGVPAELSVAGFDDVPQAEWVSPKLTSVRAPLDGIGRMAVETVTGLAAGREPLSHHIQLSTNLVIRESTAPPRDR
jgi:LacI family transcriptional regulator